MGSRNRKPPSPGGLDYNVEDLADTGSPIDGPEGYEYMLNTGAPASRSGDGIKMRTSPRVGAEPPGSLGPIGGSTSRATSSKHAEGHFSHNVSTGNKQFPGANWGK